MKFVRQIKKKQSREGNEPEDNFPLDEESLK